MGGRVEHFMGDYSFIHNYIQEGDRVLLYGMGKNGREIFRVLQSAGRCHLVGFIDVRAKELTESETPVYLPEALSAPEQLEYDKLILTIENHEICLNVYHQLITVYSVEREKIISAFVYPETFVEFTADIHQVKVGIRQFLDYQHRKIMYFAPVITGLSAREGDTAKNRLKAWIPDFLPDERIVLAYILYHARRFDAELLETVIQSALQIEDPALTDFLYGRFIDASYMVLCQEELLYPDFYIQRRELLKKLCLAYGFQHKKMEISRKHKWKIKKICFVVEMLDHPRHSPTLRYIQAANILADHGYEVVMVLLDTPSNLSQTPLLQTVLDYREVSRRYEGFHRNVLRPQITLHYPENTCNVRQKLQGQLDQIFDCTPDLIIDVSNDYSILSYLYQQYFTTVFWPVRGYVSSLYFTYIAVRDQKVFRSQNDFFHCPIAAEQECKMDLSMCIMPPDSTKVYHRETFSCEETDFLLITVGDRLGTELSNEMIDAVCGYLLVQPEIKWLVVGEQNQYFMERRECFQNQMIYIPYEEDLPALYKICDVYLNPLRMGGGVSMVWAMYYKLPVAMLSAPSDITAIVGIENTVGDTYEDMMRYVLSLRENPWYHTLEREKFQQRAVRFAEKRERVMLDLVLRVEQLEQKRTAQDERKIGDQTV